MPAGSRAAAQTELLELQGKAREFFNGRTARWLQNKLPLKRPFFSKAHAAAQRAWSCSRHLRARLPLPYGLPHRRRAEPCPRVRRARQALLRGEKLAQRQEEPLFAKRLVCTAEKAKRVMADRIAFVVVQGNVVHTPAPSPAGEIHCVCPLSGHEVRKAAEPPARRPGRLGFAGRTVCNRSAEGDRDVPQPPQSNCSCVRPENRRMSIARPACSSR